MQYLITSVGSELFRQVFMEKPDFAMYHYYAQKYDMTSGQAYAVIYVNPLNNNRVIIDVAEDEAAATLSAANKVALYAKTQSIVSISGPQTEAVAAAIQVFRKAINNEHNRGDQNDLAFAFVPKDDEFMTIKFNESSS